MSDAAARIRALSEAATPGWWMGGCYYVDEKRPQVFEVFVDPGDGATVGQNMSEEDAALIVALRNAAGEIADLIEALDNVVILEHDPACSAEHNAELRRRSDSLRQARAAVEAKLVVGRSA